MGVMGGGGLAQVRTGDSAFSVANTNRGVSR